MNPKEIIHHRLQHQHIGGTTFTQPEEIVSHLTAVQSQDWAMAKWAIGLRLPGSKESDIEKVFNEGKILRTHVMRPTWHFVAPSDIHWLLKLTAPRVHALNSTYYKKFELDQKVLNKSKDIIVKALRDNHYLTREELNAKLQKGKIITDRLRLTYIMMYAELEGIICSGPRKGKQFTYALLEERAPEARKLHKEESLHELTRRYFATRGPATIQDMAWWSGLTLKEVKEGVAMLPSDFVKEKIKEQEFIFLPVELINFKNLQSTFLVPDYDEYGIGYKDRTIYYSSAINSKGPTPLDYFHMVAVDGFFGGRWNKNMQGKKRVVDIELFNTIKTSQHKAVQSAVKKYLDFFSAES